MLWFILECHQIEMSKLLIIVGCPGAGKTHYTKTLIKDVNKAALNIFDVNDEYQEFYPYPFDADMEAFVEKCKRTRKGVHVIEDATGFLPVNGRNMPLVRCLQGRRHTGNTFILLFHSMRTVPKYLTDFANAIVIFKTMDAPKRVAEMFDDVMGKDDKTLYEIWAAVQQEARTHKFFSSDPPPKGVAPPMQIFSM